MPYVEAKREAGTVEKERYYTTKRKASTKVKAKRKVYSLRLQEKPWESSLLSIESQVFMEETISTFVSIGVLGSFNSEVRSSFSFVVEQKIHISSFNVRESVKVLFIFMNPFFMYFSRADK